MRTHRRPAGIILMLSFVMVFASSALAERAGLFAVGTTEPVVKFLEKPRLYFTEVKYEFKTSQSIQ